ncbi:MAG: transposase [Acetobacteraceae bacterium]|nr:transposase [Acetobacteraceae bacterium]MBV8523626.1 transposase [Acetobacteraceae bacterium]MBV8588566.1 transposase [Acetobacteraceae bacterium]
MREARRREGSYILRSNLTGNDPAQLWMLYLQLVEIEDAFKELKDDLAIRPIYHQTDERIEAHIFVAFLAYCLQAKRTKPSCCSSSRSAYPLSRPPKSSPRTLLMRHDSASCGADRGHWARGKSTTLPDS